MRLRQRLVLTFSVITLILILPSLYGLFALRELHQVAYDLNTRDAVGALSLGRLQTAFGEVESAERIYLALASSPPEERESARRRVGIAISRVTAEMDQLADGGYESVVAPAADAWEHLQAAIAEEQQLVEAGNVGAADVHRDDVVNPAFRVMNSTLDPIGQAINDVGERQVERARTIAAGAATTTLLAVAITLAIAAAIGFWSTRSLLRPVHELRRGMTQVAEGNFDARTSIPPDREDEIGDLARSFTLMTAELTELERLRAQVVAVASHELKTPLSVIKGYVSLLRDGIYGDVPEEQAKILISVGEQTDRLARLIQQLLDISRFEAGGGRLEVQPIQPHEFFSQFASSFEVLALQNEIDFTIEVDESLPEELQGDPDRLSEVFGNLLSNAFKFTPREGRIKLTARPASRPDDEAVVIEVSDTGVGIPGEELPRIFEKFFQVENEAQPKSVGSGLGLAISKEIVDAHGGTITAESEVGRGTTFRVLLPLRRTPEAG
jgi:signal transduction histidine kinase